MLPQPHSRSEIRFDFRRSPGRAFSILTVTTPLGVTKPFEISDPDRKAASLNTTLPAILRDFREVTGQRSVKLDETFLEAALYQSRSVSRQVAQLLFGGWAQAQDFMGTLNAAIAPVFAETNSDWRSWPIINVIQQGDEPLAWAIPLEFFPFATPAPKSPEGDLSIESFLGFRAPIIRASGTGKRQLNRDSADRIATLLLSTRDELPGVQAQREYFKASTRDFNVYRWPAKNQQFALPPLPDMTRIWIQRREVIHLACHYRAARPGSSSPAEFDFGHGCVVGSGALAGELAQYLGEGGHPLVFINACESAAALDTYGAIVKKLQELGYADIIGTRCLLPDRFGGEFAKMLYEQLISDDTPSLADAMVITRKRMADAGNPAGLLYVHYGSQLLRAQPKNHKLAVMHEAPPEERGISSKLKRWFMGL